MLALDVVLPLIAVQLSLHARLSAVIALSLAALFPLADTILGFVQSRTVSIIGAVSLIAIVTGIGLAFATGNALFAILKDSAFSLVFSLLFLASLAAKRPLVFRLNQQMLGPAGAALDEAWTQRPGVRKTFRLMTLVWGVGLLLEALLRVVASFTLPVATAAATSPWIALGCIGGLIGWTVVYAQARRRAATRAGISLP
jgi:intracellular septation protein A